MDGLAHRFSDERFAMPTALITGGTTGIGSATADLLHARGYQVAVTGQNADSLARARSELPDDVLVVRSDARVLSDTDALMSAVSARLGSLDLLFLNAGIFRPAPVADVTEESFDEHADLNFKGQYFTLQKALSPHERRRLDRADRGHRIPSRQPWRHGGGGDARRSAGDGALARARTGSAQDSRQRREPRGHRHPLFDKLGVPQSGRDAMRAKIPFERFGSSQEVAEVVAFLASDAAGYITGQDVTGAGGYGLGA